MKYKKLSELCEVIMGQAPSGNMCNKNGEGIAFVKVGQFGDIYPKVDEWTMKPLKIAKDKDILICVVGATVGKLNLGIDCAIGRSVAAIRMKDNKMNYKYLYYYLKIWTAQLRELSQGSAIGTIGREILNNLNIPYTDINKQEDIVVILDNAQNLIDNRKKQINLLDEFVKSKFIEMFGDAVLNPKKWKIKSVIEVCDCMVPGRDKPKSFTGDVPWITIEDLNINSVTFKSKSNLGLTDDEISEVKRKKIPKDSVIMSCVGNLGICSIAGTDMIINQQLHSFQCREINNVFLMYYLGFREDYMLSQASNTTVLYMNKTACNSIPVYLPPVELQNTFRDFVQQVDKLKFEIEKSLRELEDNFNSLMQKAFKGELTK